MTAALALILLIALYIAGNAALDEPAVQSWLARVGVAVTRLAVALVLVASIPACASLRPRTVQIGGLA